MIFNSSFTDLFLIIIFFKFTDYYYNYLFMIMFLLRNNGNTVVVIFNEFLLNKFLFSINCLWKFLLYKS